MKNIKGFLIMDFIILLIKALSGILFNSYTMLFSGFYEIILIIVLLFSTSKKENTKTKSYITLLLSTILILLNIFGIYIIFKKEILKPSLWLIIFIIITLLMRYVIQCFKTMKSFNMKKGLLSISNMVSNHDFYMAGITLLSLILCKVSKWLNILKYADKICVIVISIFIIIKLVKIFINSIKSLNNEFTISEEYKKEILDRKEVKNINLLKVFNHGGIRTTIIDLNLNNGIGSLDANSFIVTLTDYLLKKCEVVEVWLGSTNIRNGGLNDKLASIRNQSRNNKTNKKRKK